MDEPNHFHITTTRHGSRWDITVTGADAPFAKVSWLNRPSLGDCLRHARTLGVPVDVLAEHVARLGKKAAKEIQT